LSWHRTVSAGTCSALAESEGRAVGFVLFFATYSTFLARPGIYVEDLYVEASQRGLGFGRALLGHVFDQANQRDCGRVEWSVLTWNQPAIDFYRSLGAQELEEWRMYRVQGRTLASLAGHSG
jgi:GNAT superfamily N-acetyltransferase